MISYNLRIGSYLIIRYYLSTVADLTGYNFVTCMCVQVEVQHDHLSWPVLASKVIGL